MITKECAYSFSDLFMAAQGRAMTAKEQVEFRALTQSARNSAVQKLAAVAGWKTREITGTDGKCYTAFCPANV